MRAKGWEERLRELDEMAMALNVARGTAINVQGKAEGWWRAASTGWSMRRGGV
jgi:hypothetical protein